MDQGVEEIDDALLRLRRLWAASRHRVMHDGVTRVELSSLLVVEACARCAARGEEANVSDVAALADVTPSTASRLVDTGERAGLLSRSPSERSARQTALELTAAGAGLRERALTARRAWLAEQLAGWSREDVHRFGSLLQRFADGVHEPGADNGPYPGAR